MFKTAQELGIEPWERQRLEEMLTYLDTVVHIPEAMLKYDKAHAPVFNMNHGAVSYDCGTVACIGGWCKLREENAVMTELTPQQINRANMYVGDIEGPLRDLYYPFYDDRESVNYESINTVQAKEAIVNFLNTGNPKWESILTPEQTYEEEE